MTCPTAYHLKCLPQDLKAIRLTKKYIICGKHNLSQDDFPKYEEKTSTNIYTTRGGNGGVNVATTGATLGGSVCGSVTGTGGR